MIRRAGIAIALTLGTLAAGTAEAQMGYPGGYGGYGMSRAGGRTRSRIHGVSRLLRPRQGRLRGRESQGRRDQRRDDAEVERRPPHRQIQIAKDTAAVQAERKAELQERVDRLDDRDGTTLNDLLFQIFDSDPGVAHASRVATP